MKEKHVADISNVCNAESYCWRGSLNAAIVVASERRRCVLIVVGCANPPAPAGATVSRDGDVLTVRCNLTGETWYLTCSRSRWIGSVGNCSAHASE